MPPILPETVWWCMARKNAGYGDSRRYHDWLDRAREDITCARLLLTDDNCYNSAAFHCQQTLEKALKSYILLKSNILVDGHSLTWLCKRAAKYDGFFTEYLEACAALNKCYIETRYPADIPLEMEYKRVKEYYDASKQLFLRICEEVDSVLDNRRAHPGQGAAAR